jgi:AraC-like DNA-binding protein
LKLETSRINPVLLRGAFFDGYQYEVRDMAQRVVYDYEFEYFIRSDGGIIVDGEYIRFQERDVNVRKPGQVVRGIGPYACYVACVDMVGNRDRKGTYLFGSEEEAQPRYENPLLDRLPNRITVSAYAKVEELMARLKLDGGLPGDARALDAKAALMELISVLIAEASETVQPRVMSVSTAIARISEGYAEPVSIGTLVEASGMSRAAFFAAFKRETGVTPLQMITDLRMERARLFLRLTELPVAEVGRICGYEDNAYFTRVFTRREGMTPTEYRKGHA